MNCVSGYQILLLGIRSQEHNDGNDIPKYLKNKYYVNNYILLEILWWKWRVKGKNNYIQTLFPTDGNQHTDGDLDTMKCLSIISNITRL